MRGGATPPAIAEGAGFTVTRRARGTFDITFDQPFSAAPTVVCSGTYHTPGDTTGGATQCMVNHPDSLTGSKVRVVITNGSNDTQDWPFTFVAIGPR